MKLAATALSSPLSFESIGSEVSQLLPTMAAIDDIALGWTDALLFDGKYISPKLKSKTKTCNISDFRESVEFSVQGSTSSEQLLCDLPVDGPVVELAEAVERLNKLPESALLRDDYSHVAEDQLHAILGNSFIPGRFNLVIIGAGPVGVLMAASLKKELGQAIDILLIESRVSTAHLKKPYNRRWQTNIPLSLIDKMLHPKAALACARTGDGHFIGVDICSLESLALLSARAVGVRCLFVEQDPLDWLAEAPVHLLVDASGARWRKPGKLEEKIYPGLLLKQATTQAQSYVDYGVVRSTSIPNSRVDVRHKDGWLQPLYRGGAIKQSLIKVQDIPIACYQPLLQWILQNNQDNKFYLWPGRKHAEINRLLLFVSMTAKEHQVLSRFISGDNVELIDVIQWCEFKSSMDPRLQSLLRQIYAHGKAHCTASVSRPFIFEPRMLDPDVTSDTFHKIPVLPIGDSFFSGNPKSGNGLGVHLHHIRAVSSQLVGSLTKG